MNQHTTENVPDSLYGFQMYGVTLNLHCNYPPLGDYMVRLMPGMAGPAHKSPDLEVYSLWIETPHERGVSLFPDGPHLNGIGKRMQIGDNELVWFNTHRDKDLQLRFRRQGERTIFDVAYCFQPSPKKAAKYPDFKTKKFFDLARYLVFFPIAWQLERERGWTLIHASAVVRDGQAVMIAGPGGAGKTTTCISLIAREKMQLLTENLLFWDGEGGKIYPVIEPLRLTDESRALLARALPELAPIELPGGLRSKTMYWLPEGQALQSARPGVVFMPQFSQQSFITPIPPAIAAEQIQATNRLTLELNDYYWYTAALDLLWPAPGNAIKQHQALQELTARTPCFHLGIDKSAGVEAVVHQIMDCLQTLNEPKEETL